MFERFTDRARKALVLGQEEARLLRHGHVGAEHLLLGLLRDERSVAALALRAVGVELEDLRERVAAAAGPGEDVGAAHVPFTADAKKSLELSLREALQLGHHYIGTEHLLLGIIRADTSATRVLEAAGAEPNRVRQEVIRLLAGEVVSRSPVGSRPATVPLDDLGDDVVQALIAAREEAKRLGRGQVDAACLLVGLAAGAGPAAEALRRAGATPETLRTLGDRTLILEDSPPKAGAGEAGEEALPPLGQPVHDVLRQASARRVADRPVNVEHVLAVLVSMIGAGVERLLRGAGVDVDALRRHFGSDGAR